MKKTVYIFFFSLIVFFTNISFFILNKEHQYKPRTFLLRDLSSNSVVSSVIQKELINCTFLIKQFRLYGKVYEINVQHAENDFQVWLKFSKENDSNILVVNELYKIPNNGSNFEKFQNYHHTLYVCGLNYGTAPLNFSVSNLTILNNCLYKPYYCKPETPPPQKCV